MGSFIRTFNSTYSFIDDGPGSSQMPVLHNTNCHDSDLNVFSVMMNERNGVVLHSQHEAGMDHTMEINQVCDPSMKDALIKKAPGGPLGRRRKQLVVDNVSPTLSNYVMKRNSTSNTAAEELNSKLNNTSSSNGEEESVLPADVAPAAALPTRAPRPRRKYNGIDRDHPSLASSTTHVYQDNSRRNEQIGSNNMWPPVGPPVFASHDSASSESSMLDDVSMSQPSNAMLYNHGRKGTYQTQLRSSASMNGLNNSMLTNTSVDGVVGTVTGLTPSIDSIHLHNKTAANQAHNELFSPFSILCSKVPTDDSVLATNFTPLLNGKSQLSEYNLFTQFYYLFLSHVDGSTDALCMSTSNFSFTGKDYAMSR